MPNKTFIHGKNESNLIGIFDSPTPRINEINYKFAVNLKFVVIKTMKRNSQSAYTL